MKLVSCDMIPEIDRFAVEFIGIAPEALMKRSARGCERVLRERVEKGKRIVILAGKGNNGGDGYALATLLYEDYDVTVVDIFSSGQRTEEGQYYYSKYLDLGGTLIKGGEFDPKALLLADAVVDAIFGTGFVGEIPTELSECSKYLRAASAFKLAIDVPLGIKSDTGEVYPEFLYTPTVTVCLSYPKVGLMSYPAKEYVGELVIDNLSLPKETVEREFSFDSFALDEEALKDVIPPRPENSNKGSFGKVLMLSGSDKYRGAAHLSLEAALRGGAGLVHFFGEKELCYELRQKFPEAIYTVSAKESVSDIDAFIALSESASSILIGPGCGRSLWLYDLVKRLLALEGCPLILDADAINVLSEHRFEVLDILRHSARKVVLTPHPLEFARLIGRDVGDVQSARLRLAREFSSDTLAILVLKGAGTVVTDGRTTYINTTGSSALAKGGSGDVLAGLIASLSAFGDPLYSAASGVYLHGLAADTLSGELSEYATTPSDLPREIGKQISKILK